MELSINIPGNIGPVDRGRLFADPLNAALTAAGAGKTGDEGTQMGIVDGKLAVVSCDIMVTVTDLDRALTVIREVMKGAGAPASTTITQFEPEKVVHTL